MLQSAAVTVDPSFLIWDAFDRSSCEKPMTCNMPAARLKAVRGSIVAQRLGPVRAGRVGCKADREKSPVYKKNGAAVGIRFVATCTVSKTRGVKFGREWSCSMSATLNVAL